MTLHDVIESDATAVFCNDSDFAELVTYFARGGTTREIKAIVIREALSILPEDGDNVIPIFEVHVANSCLTGIASQELDLGGDQLEFAMRVGQEKFRRSITKLLGHDEGMLVLECR